MATSAQNLDMSILPEFLSWNASGNFKRQLVLTIVVLLAPSEFSYLNYELSHQKFLIFPPSPLTLNSQRWQHYFDCSVLQHTQTEIRLKTSIAFELCTYNNSYNRFCSISSQEILRILQIRHLFAKIGDPFPIL